MYAPIAQSQGGMGMSNSGKFVRKKEKQVAAILEKFACGHVKREVQYFFDIVITLRMVFLP